MSQPGYRFFKVAYASSGALGSGGNYSGIRSMAIIDPDNAEYPDQYMSGNTTPSPLVAVASTEFSSTYAAWKAFDSSDSSYWSSSVQSGANQTLTIDLGEGTLVIPHMIRLLAPGGSNARLPYNGTIEGSKDGVSYDVLATLTNYDWGANDNLAQLDSPDYNDPPIWQSGTDLGPYTITFPVLETLSATDTEGETVSYAVTSGTLPSGLGLTGNQISGTPNSLGENISFTITATDESGASASQAYSVTVRPISDFLLDKTTATAAAAYSTRQLSQDYSGPLLRLRNGSSNAEADIPADGNGDLDAAAISAHLSGASGFVTIWYDQSGNNNHARMTNTSKQPQLSGNMLQFDGSNDQLLMDSNSFSHLNDALTVFAAISTADSNAHVVGTGSASGGFLTSYGHALYVSGGNLRFKANSGSSGLNLNGSASLGSPRVVSVTERPSSTSSLYLGSSSIDSSSTSPNAYNYATSAIGASAGSGSTADIDEFAGSIGEIIVYDEALEDTDSTGRSDILQNMGDHW